MEGGGESAGGGGRVEAVWTEVQRECRLEAGPSGGDGPPMRRCEVLRRVLRVRPGGGVEEVERSQETTREPWDGFWTSGGRGHVRPEWNYPGSPRDVVVPAERLARALEEWVWSGLPGGPSGPLPTLGTAGGQGASPLGGTGGREASLPEYMRPFWREDGASGGGRDAGGPFSRDFLAKEGK